MFLGYQDNKIALVAETREELENNIFITFDSIEESAENYLLYNGEYITAAEAAERETRDNVLNQIKILEDSITARNYRAALTGDEYALNKIQEIENQIAELRKQL